MLIQKDLLSRQIMTFDQLCISESLKPLKVDYGTDLKNLDWFSNSEKQFWTFFKSKNLYYCVIIDNEDVGFATSDVFNTKLNSMEKVVRYFNFDERKTSSALKIFPFSLYVILEGLSKFNINKFKFSAQNPSLGVVYKKMVYDNKYFLSGLREYGFEFDGEENDNYIFRKNN